MKKVFLSIVAIAALVALPMSVSAQAVSATDNFTGHVRILLPITLERNANLEFGVVARTASTAGSLTILGAEGAGITSASNLTPVTASTSTQPHPAKFTVTGNGGSAYTITINNGSHTSIPVGGSSSGITLDLYGAENTADLPASGNIGGSSTLTYTSATSVFYIGGKLNVATSAVAGDYTSADIPVTVAYN